MSKSILEFLEEVSDKSIGIKPHTEHTFSPDEDCLHCWNEYRVFKIAHPDASWYQFCSYKDPDDSYENERDNNLSFN